MKWSMSHRSLEPWNSHELLRENQLYVKVEKCKFHTFSVSFLGYIKDQNGLAMDSKKVSVVHNWPQPKTIKELQRFLEFANFYHRFIRSYSVITAPLTSHKKRTNLGASSPPHNQCYRENRQTKGRWYTHIQSRGQSLAIHQRHKKCTMKYQTQY